MLSVNCRNKLFTGNRPDIANKRMHKLPGINGSKYMWPDTLNNTPFAVECSYHESVGGGQVRIRPLSPGNSAAAQQQKKLHAGNDVDKWCPNCHNDCFCVCQHKNNGNSYVPRVFS